MFRPFGVMVSDVSGPLCFCGSFLCRSCSRLAQVSGNLPRPCGLSDAIFEVLLFFCVLVFAW